MLATLHNTMFVQNYGYKRPVANYKNSLISIVAFIIIIVTIIYFIHNLDFTIMWLNKNINIRYW